MIEPKLKLKAFLSLFREWVNSWMDTNPDHKLLQLAHTQVGDIYARLGKKLQQARK